jgi:hypothetical protein
LQIIYDPFDIVISILDRIGLIARTFAERRNGQQSLGHIAQEARVLQHNETPNEITPPPRHVAFLFGLPAQIGMWQSLGAPLGCTVTEASALANDPSELDPQINFDLLLIDLLSETERHPEHLSNISSYLNAGNTEAIIWTDLERLDEAYAALPAAQCQFLVGASDSEAVLLMAKAIKRGKMDLVHGGNRQIEFSALHRISDELADFAKTLARIAEQDEDTARTGFNEKPVSFRPAPAAIMQPLAQFAAAPTAQIAPSYIREVIKLRRLRDRHFGAELFADPAWDILLDLFAARIEGVAVSVSSLCIAAAVPATTALRWISAMTTNGILLRRHDPDDARRVFIELSDETVSQMNAYFSEAQRRGALAT